MLVVENYIYFWKSKGLSDENNTPPATTDYIALLQVILVLKDILVLGEGPTQELNVGTLTAEKNDLTNFTEKNKKFCLSFNYNVANSYLLFNGVATPLCLGNISKDFSVDFSI